jgi:hypothetical protein
MHHTIETSLPGQGVVATCLSTGAARLTVGGDCRLLASILYPGGREATLTVNQVRKTTIGSKILLRRNPSPDRTIQTYHGCVLPCYNPAHFRAAKQLV